MTTVRRRRAGRAEDRNCRLPWIISGLKCLSEWSWLMVLLYRSERGRMFGWLKKCLTNWPRVFFARGLDFGCLPTREKTMKKTDCLAAAALMLTGCVIAPPYYDNGRGHGRGNGQGQDYDDGGYHCPPGQAKKGRC